MYLYLYLIIPLKLIIFPHFHTVNQLKKGRAVINTMLL